MGFFLAQAGVGFPARWLTCSSTIQRTYLEEFELTSVPPPDLADDRTLSIGDVLFLYSSVTEGSPIHSLSLFPPPPRHLKMPSESNPTNLSPNELSKLNKKALIENLTAVQGMYAECRKKYSMYPLPPLHQQATANDTDEPTRQGKDHHTQQQGDDQCEEHQHRVDSKTPWPSLPRLQPLRGNER